MITVSQKKHTTASLQLDAPEITLIQKNKTTLTSLQLDASEENPRLVMKRIASTEKHC